MMGGDGYNPLIVVEIQISREVKAHVGIRDDVLAQGKIAECPWFTVEAMFDKKVDETSCCTQDGYKHHFLPKIGLFLIFSDDGVTRHLETDGIAQHVAKGGHHEDDKNLLMDRIVLSVGNVCNTNQTRVLDSVQPKIQSDQMLKKSSLIFLDKV